MVWDTEFMFNLNIGSPALRTVTAEKNHADGLNKRRGGRSNMESDDKSYMGWKREFRLS